MVVTKWVVGIEKDDWFCAGVGVAIIVLDIQSVSWRRWLWLFLTVAEVLPDSNKETIRRIADARRRSRGPGG